MSSTESYRYVITSESISVHFPDGPLTITKSGNATQYNTVRQRITSGQWEGLQEVMSLKHGIQNWSQGNFQITGDVVSHKGTKLPSNLHARIISMYKEGKPSFQNLINFWERLDANPSYRSVEQLYNFLKNAHIPIGPDGCFYTYKSVRGDHLDHHTGSFDNSPGVVQRLPRNRVSDDPNVPCHEGFHVGALSYVRNFHSDSKVVIAKIDPANVVCVPSDASAGKMRVCEYAIIGLWTGKVLPDLVWDPETESDSYLVRYVAPKGMDVVPGTPRVGDPAPSVSAKSTPALSSLQAPEQPVQLFDVVISDLGEKPVEVCRTLRATMDKSLSDIAQMLKTLPLLLLQKVPQQSAIDLKERLHAVGATADFYSTGLWVPPPTVSKPTPVEAVDKEEAPAAKKPEKKVEKKATKVTSKQKEVPTSAPVPATDIRDEFTGMPRIQLRPIAKKNGVARFGKLTPDELREALRALKKIGALKK